MLSGKRSLVVLVDARASTDQKMLSVKEFLAMVVDIEKLEVLLAKCQPGPVQWEGMDVSENEDGTFIWIPEASTLGNTGIQTGHSDFENAGNEHLLLQEARNALPELIRLLKAQEHRA